MSECIFCNIAAGKINADVVYDDQRVMAFRDVSPKAPVHILIIPKKHIERVSAVTEEDLGIVADIHRAIQRVAIKENVSDSGFRLITNNGKDAGQTVDHLHYHLLGGKTMSWQPV